MKAEYSQYYEKKICEKLHLTADEMFWLVFNEGERFLYKQCMGDKGSVAFLINKRFFWNWWKSNWDLRNQLFMVFVKLDEKTDMSLSEIAELRVAYEYFNARTINSDEFDKSYCHIMHLFIKKSAREAVYSK